MASLGRTAAAVHRRLAGRVEGLALSEVHVLQFIAEHENVTPTDLAAVTGLTSGSITSLLDRLEGRGFVERRPSKEDRRAVVVQLRPGAYARAAAIMAEAHEELEPIFQGWPVARIDELAKLLEELHIGRVGGNRRRH